MSSQSQNLSVQLLSNLRIPEGPSCDGNCGGLGRGRGVGFGSSFLVMTSISPVLSVRGTLVRLPPILPYVNTIGGLLVLALRLYPVSAVALSVSSSALLSGLGSTTCPDDATCSVSSMSLGLKFSSCSAPLYSPVISSAVVYSSSSQVGSSNTTSLVPMDGFQERFFP